MGSADLSFQEKAQSKEFTQDMNKDSTHIFAQAIMAEVSSRGKQGLQTLDKLPEQHRSFLMRILQKRIEVLKLPITLTVTGAMAIEALAEGNPGKGMAILIDCLTKHEGQNITAEILAELYPWGFYNEKTFEDYVDNYLKERRVKWAEIY